MIERYKQSVEPAYTDARDIDRDVGRLSGEGATQISGGGADKHIEKISSVWKQLPEPSGDPTYYDRPMLQQSVWTWAIPAYYYVGGLSGASMVLSAALSLRKRDRLDELVQRCHIVGFAGTVLSGALLIYDLGRPARFLNMLRVFRPTSPMNMGAWILSATGGTAFLTIALRRDRGLIGVVGETFGVLSGIFGLGLSTYTGVLAANTAIPVWQASRNSLPVLFGASAMASIGCAIDIFGADLPGAAAAHTFGVIGRVAEVAAGICMEHESSAVPRVGRPLKRGWSGVLWRTATVLTAASLVLAVLPGSSRKRRVSSGVLGSLGSLLMRFSVEEAGKASAVDPRASFHAQRSAHVQHPATT